MYAVSEDRPRGSSAGQSSREFPVLFHLMDVSRPHAKPAPTIDSANLLSAVEQLHWPPDDNEPSPPAVATSETAAVSPVASSAEIPPTIETEPAEAEAPAASSEGAAATAENIVAAGPPPEPAPTADETAAAASPPDPPRPAPSLVTLRKKPKTSASEDWFASHGKFIAVAFVLALLATIYFARVNRERASVATQETAPQPPLVDAAPAVVVASQATPSSAAEVATVPTTSTASSPAAPSAPSPVELRAPQLVAESSSDTIKDTSDKPKDNLFEFAAAKNADDRVAARPDDPSKTPGIPSLSGAALAAPSLAPPSQPGSPEVIANAASQYPASSPAMPTETTAYPVTSSTNTHYPVSIPSASAYPTTSPPQPAAPGYGSPGGYAPPAGNGYQSPPQYVPPARPAIDYRSQYPVTPPSMPQQQPAGQAWNGGQPASYPSYDTTARGPRNERTGSGTY